MESASCFACDDGSPHEPTVSASADSFGPDFASQAMRRVEAARCSIPVPPPAAKIIIGARIASSIANERKNSRSISIFSSTSTTSIGNCPTFIDSMRAAWPRTSAGLFAKATPPMPALDYYGIEELFTDDERTARDRARRFVQEEAIQEIMPFHRAGKFPEHLIPRMGVLHLFAPYLTEHVGAELTQAVRVRPLYLG